MEDIEYFSDTFEALQLFKNLEYQVFIVTNQSGVGRGYFTMESVQSVHQKMQEDFVVNGVGPIVDFAICPHTPEDQCLCRKPSGEMIRELLHKYQLDPTKSFMIGDKLIDVQAGNNAGIQGILLRSSPPLNFQGLYFKTLLDFAHSLRN